MSEKAQPVTFWYIKLSFEDRAGNTIPREFYRSTFAINNGFLFISFYSEGDDPVEKGTFSRYLSEIDPNSLHIVPSHYDTNIGNKAPSDDKKEGKRQTFIDGLFQRMKI